MKHEESILQRQCIKWFRLQYPKHVIFAIPNGGYRSPKEAAIMHGEGVLAGVADLFVMHANDSAFGLFIELKSKEGRLTTSQKLFAQAAIAEAYDCVVCRRLMSL